MSGLGEHSGAQLVVQRSQITNFLNQISGLPFALAINVLAFYPLYTNGLFLLV